MPKNKNILHGACLKTEYEKNKKHCIKLLNLYMSKSHGITMLCVKTNVQENKIGYYINNNCALLMVLYCIVHWTILIKQQQLVPSYISPQKRNCITTKYCTMCSKLWQEDDIREKCRNHH